MRALIDALERKPKGKPDMSPHAVNSFVNDLVAMAHAMERLPQVEAELAEWQERTSKRTDHIVALESNIIGYKAEIERLYAQIHELEVAKDAAETMFLEADDRTTRALEFVKAQFGAAGSLIQALELPRAEPPKPTQEWSGSPNPANPDNEWIKDGTNEVIPADPIISEVKPIEPNPHEQRLWEEATDYNANINDRIHANNELATLQGVDADTAQGQSEPDPTQTAAISTAEPVASAPVPATQSENVSSGTTTEPSPGPYSNKRYYDHPIYVSLDAWLADGGTEADYHWRPSHDYGKDSPF